VQAQPDSTAVLSQAKRCLQYLVVSHVVLIALVQEDSLVYSLKCNISQDVNYLHQGITLGLVEDRCGCGALQARWQLCIVCACTPIDSATTAKPLVVL
jgi:hypothetical protein